MAHVYVDNISSHVGQQVTVKGWLYNKTHKGKLYFLLVRDGTGTIQAVAFRDDVDDEVFDTCERLTQESSIIVTGTVREDKRSPGGYELSLTDVEIVQLVEEYPLGPKEHGAGFLMDHRHLWLRSSRQYCVLRVRSEVCRAAREFLDDRGFIAVDGPIFTGAACEGTTTLFETDYFGEKAYLTQSGQLYMEAAAMAFGKVYCFGPTFRAEKSKTRRHLTEFWMLEPEVAYADLDDTMSLAEDMVAHIVARVLERRARELETLERDTAPLQKVSAPFPRMTYDEAVTHVRGEWEKETDPEIKSELAIEWGDDLGGRHETVVGEKFDKPVFVHRYPIQCKAFYMKPDPDNENLSLSVDLIAPEGYGEIIGGGQRLDDLAVLEKRMQEHDISPESMAWYTDLRKYGTVPHAGFGLGIERTVAWLCGIAHVREAIPFPRLMHRLYP